MTPTECVTERERLYTVSCTCWLHFPAHRMWCAPAGGSPSALWHTGGFCQTLWIPISKPDPRPLRQSNQDTAAGGNTISTVFLHSGEKHRNIYEKCIRCTNKSKHQSHIFHPATCLQSQHGYTGQLLRTSESICAILHWILFLSGFLEHQSFSSHSLIWRAPAYFIYNRR